eukprot:2632748-Pleurochrysis_carterae.AAC.2
MHAHVYARALFAFDLSSVSRRLLHLSSKFESSRSALNSAECSSCAQDQAHINVSTKRPPRAAASAGMSSYSCSG